MRSYKPDALLVVALIASLPVSAVQAQDQHGSHHPSAVRSTHDHFAAEHEAKPGHQGMDHGSTDHSRHHPSNLSNAGSSTQPRPRSPIPVITSADRAAAFPDLPAHDMHQGSSHFMFVADELEWQDADEGSTLAWDLNGWMGSDIDRLAFRSEGERTNGHTEEAELQLLWSHAIGPWWETVVGVRQDFKPGSPQTWVAFGVQGMPLYGLETEATAFIGEAGQSALRLEAEYDVLLTQRWVLQPKAEINLHGRNDERRGVGAGFSDASVGLRLRYEISRQFAPYLGVTWTRAYGSSADMQRADGEDTSEARLVAGIRFWF